MSCASKIGHSMTAGTMPLGLIARDAELLIGEGSYQAAGSRAYHQDDIVRNELADTEHRDPKHVWGDEGPVND